LAALFLVTPEIVGREKMLTVVEQVTRLASPVGRPYRALHGKFPKASVGPLIVVLIFAAFYLVFAVKFLVAGRDGLLNIPVWQRILFVTSIWWMQLAMFAVISLIEDLIKGSRSLLGLGAILFIAGYVCLIWATFVLPAHG